MAEVFKEEHHNPVETAAMEVELLEEMDQQVELVELIKVMVV